MNNHQEITQLIKSISGQANMLVIPRVYIDIAGDHAAALFLNQCVYWSDRGKDGWFYKSSVEWEEETGLSNYQIKRIREKLEPYIETKLKRANGAPTYHYRVKMRFLTNSILKVLENQETNKSDIEETNKSDIEETNKSLTETTQEITQENTNKEFPSFATVSSAVWSFTKIPPPNPGGRGWDDWEDGVNRLIQIEVERVEIEHAVKILDEVGYKYSGPGSLVKTIINARKKNKRKNVSQSVGGQLVE